MTQEDKELLLKDLCARLPYGVMVRVEVNDVFITPTDEVATVNTINMLDYPQKFRITPYLRPMSSMTEEEFNEYHNIKYNKVTNRDNYKRIDVGKFHNIGIIPIEEYLDWLNSHYFDYRGLIEKGLALEAPEGMYDSKNNTKI
jgi:hypothetical protein